MDGEYVGERNAAGQREVRGTYTFASRAVYEGGWRAGGGLASRRGAGDCWDGCGLLGWSPQESRLRRTLVAPAAPETTLVHFTLGCRYRK